MRSKDEGWVAYSLTPTTTFDIIRDANGDTQSYHGTTYTIRVRKGDDWLVGKGFSYGPVATLHMQTGLDDTVDHSTGGFSQEQFNWPWATFCDLVDEPDD